MRTWPSLRRGNLVASRPQSKSGVTLSAPFYRAGNTQATAVAGIASVHSCRRLGPGRSVTSRTLADQAVPSGGGSCHHVTSAHYQMRSDVGSIDAGLFSRH
jgi:hypothetical protein